MSNEHEVPLNVIPFKNESLLNNNPKKKYKVPLDSIPFKDEAVSKKHN